MIRSRSILRAVYGLWTLVLAAGPVAAMGDPAKPIAASIVGQLVGTNAGAHCVVIRFAIEPKWHLYWSNPGDSGAPPTVQLTLPTGWRAHAPLFPRPTIMGKAGDRTFGYENSLDLLVPVTPPAGVPAGEVARSIAIGAKIGWLACKESVCVLGNSELSAEVSTEPAPDAVLATLRSYPTRLPPSISASVEGVSEHQSLVISAKVSAGSPAIQFIPDAVAGIEFLDGTGPMHATVLGDRVMIRLAFALHPQDAVDGPPRLRGLLLMGSKDSDLAYQIDLAPPVVPVGPR